MRRWKNWKRCSIASSTRIDVPRPPFFVPLGYQCSARFLTNLSSAGERSSWANSTSDRQKLRACRSASCKASSNCLSVLTKNPLPAPGISSTRESFHGPSSLQGPSCRWRLGSVTRGIRSHKNRARIPREYRSRDARRAPKVGGLNTGRW